MLGELKVLSLFSKENIQMANRHMGKKKMLIITNY